jgi:hypothetical protein
VKFCARCDQRIGEDEERVPYDSGSPTGAGMTLWLHARPCKKALIQTSPVSRADEPIREG